MEHVAIDLGSRESHVCRRTATGEILESSRLKTARLEKYLKRLPTSRVVVETCAEAFHIADLALEQGHEVRVVPATLVKALGVGARGVKTDERDAATLSEVSCRIDLPSVHVPSRLSREQKALSGSRDRLVAARTMLINKVRGWLRGRTIVIPSRYAPKFTEKVRVAALASGDLPIHIERLLIVIEEVTEQIRAADKELVALTDGDLHRRLMTVPGIGPVTAVRFVATIDVQRRFPNAHALESYLGLTAGEHSSGSRTRRTGITKAGSPALRCLLVQAAWSAMNGKTHRNDPMIVWARRIADRRSSCIAAVALARKLTGILYAIWRDGSRYDPTRGGKKSIG